MRAAGFTTSVCTDGVRVGAIASASNFDLLIVDVDSPRLGGIALLRRLLERDERLPVLVLAGPLRVPGVVAEIDPAADDYIVKPYAFDELVERVRRRIRPAPTATAVLEAGDLRLDLHNARLTLNSAEVTLTGKELRLLETFMRRRGEVLDRKELLSHVWGFDSSVASNVVDVYVGYLRGKLGRDRFETVRGSGYRMP